MSNLVPSVGTTLVLPASLAQERLWFVDRLRPGTAVYNVPVSLRLTSAVSRTVIERCLFELVRRHETLRTTFASENGRSVQVIAPPRQPELSDVDLRRFPPREREARLAALATAESRVPFDLANGPLFRATLYRLAANDHALLLVFHHIISDGWSVEVLVHELGLLYAAFEAGLPSPLAPLPIQYGDWASWQREWMEGGALDEELSFWRRRLEGAPVVLDLPTDRPRPERPSHRGDLELFVVDAGLADRLRALSHAHGCTLYMTCLAAFATLLARYAGQLDLLIGTPMTNRSRPELESIVGLFVNTVVLRVDLRNSPTVSELLERVRSLMLDVYAHAEVPLEKVIETLQPERSAGRHPLFQVLFSLNASAAQAASPNQQNAKTALPPPTTGTAKFDLSLLLNDAPAGLGGAWEYASDLFDIERIRRISAHFMRLLRAFVETPELPVDALPLMDAAEERELVAFERAPRRRHHAALVHERIFAQARRTPDAVAVESAGEIVTYAELTARATKLAQRLCAEGVSPGERVGIFLRRDANLIAAMVAVHAAGGAYVPLDPSHPRERLAHIAGDAGLILAVTDGELAARLPEGVRTLLIDGDDAAADAPPLREADPGDLAYVLYTSGTTGRPKGVAVPHRAVAALLDWASQAFGREEWARVLASTSINFDISVFEIFLPLTEGGSIVVVENVLALASRGAPDVTLINTVPSAMRELLRLWTPGPSLRTINLAGEALARDLVDRIVEKASGVTVWNLYGPTETTVYSTGTRVDPDDRATPSIGRPIDGTTVYLLDQRLARVPIGVPGELYIAGAGVARGYLGHPELTAERYLSDPFTGGRMYRTGDVVLWRSDATLEYRGRVDQQVKLRGHRIELAEIESTLRKHPRVGEAVVVMRRSTTGDAQLVAYAVMDAAAVAELEALARRELPSYMVPSRYVFVDEMPRTATGKIDRAALPAPPDEEELPAREPATETEAALRELFAAALERASFDVDADFFAAGGHSLLATGVVARANEILGVELPLSAIFEHPTPASLAAYVDALPEGRAAVKPRRRERAEGPLPLAFAQQGMWFYHRLRPKTALYNLPVILPTRGAVDPDTLQRAVDFVIARHDALRMRFDMAAGAPVQELVDDARAVVAVHDLTNLPADERRRRARRLMEHETQRPFDLRRAPLLRVSLLLLSPEESIVALVMHHIISDGWSTDVLRSDLAGAYEAFSNGSRPALRELPLGYADYVLWQRESAQPVLKEGIAYFRERLAGAPPLLALPTDHLRPPRPSFRGGLVTFEIDARAGAALSDVAAARGATSHMAHLAVFAALLHQFARQDDVVIGIPVANRSRPEWRVVVGLFTNTLPIKVACGAHPTFAALLDRVRDAAIGAYAYEELPFDHLVQELNPARDLAHHPIFQVMLGFQEIDGDNGATANVLASTGTAKFDLSLSLTRAGDRVLVVMEYATDLFEGESMERLARRYRMLVEKLAAEPESAIDDVAPLDAEEQAWRDAGAARAPQPIAPETFATQSAPRTDVERKIVEIWGEALGHETFGVDENFFEAGGHSLAAVCVIARIAEEWGVDIPFEQIFTTPTIEELARAVEGADASSAGERPELRAVERTGPMPLSSAQERLWFLDVMAPGLPVYNISFPIPWRGPIDANALELALERLGDRHECLRARFNAPPGGGVEQVFDPFMTVDLAVTDLTGRSAGASQAEAEHVQAREARHAFDLSTGPLLRAHLVKLTANESVLFMTIHHIVADARSIDILRRDLAELYRAEVTGEPEALPELPLQFADFAVWQRTWLQGDRLASEIAYWKQKLAGAPALLALPSDRPRPSEQSFEGMQLPIALGSDLAAAVKRLATEEQATPFMVLLAIYAAVLGRWSGAHDLVIGIPIIGRPKRELEELIGFFMNTLPLRIDLAGRSTFRALVRHVREVVIEALSHEDLPFETIVQELQPRRSLAHNPLFQVMFAFQRPGVEDEAEARRTGATASGTSKFDLTLFLVEDDELRGAVEYATDLFEASTIERFASHLRAAAAAALDDPDAALGDLFRASPGDLAAIDEWNATEAQYARTSAHALCAAQAVRTPQAPAVSSSESWTYEELMRRARALAANLRAAGVGADSRVAIVAEPSPRLISSILGIWMAGGACVTLDPSYPTARLAYMAETSGARWLVGSGLGDLDMIRVDDDGDGGDDFVARDASPDQLAYVVFTSGSTGQPKGVAVPHRVLTNLIQWQQGRRKAARRTLQFASPSFDVFFQEVLLTLASGGELVIAGNETRRDPALLVDLCRARGIERLFLPFVALRELAETAAGQPSLDDLREVITAGEQLQVTPALRRWFATNPHCRLFNQYGPSETHVVTEEEMAADPAEWPALPPIGRPVANARCYILDADLRPLPIGVPGDLHLGGVPLARGYLDQPALTAERFISDPHTGGRMYRSGDRARWLADGRIEFLGRGDDQVKIRGYRVEVAEVETALASLPGVKQAVVAAQPDANGEKRLVGYVLAEESGVEPTQLRERLQGILPEPLVPAIIVVVDELPRTPSGKVDRRALPAPLVEAREMRKPANELERVVAGVWRDVLGHDQISVDESFFALGGHSLLATRVAARLRQRLGTDVPVRAIFEHPTVARLAASLGASVPEPVAPDEIAAVPRNGAPLPSSFAQERMWFLDRIAPGNPAYNLTTSMELPPGLNIDALRRALNELARRHEALRTVFHEIDGQPVQVIASGARVPLEVVDLSYLPASEVEAETRQRADEEQRRSFSLAEGPLFRATLLDFGRKGYLLLLSMHHIISDAWSLRVLHRDLGALYTAFDEGRRPSLPPLRVQYADFAAWQREQLSGELLDALLAYWREHLANAPHRVEMPTDRPRTRTQARRGSTLRFELDDVVSHELAAIAQEEGATLFMTMLALYAEILRRQTRQEDFLVGTPIGARPRPELEEVVGLFVNTLVLRADLAGEPTFRALIRRVREETLAAYSHAELPFERLVEELAPPRELGANPLIQVAFGLHHGMAADSMSGNGTAKFELSFVMAEADGKLSGIFEYDRDLFDETTIERMAEHLARLAREAVDAPDEPLSRHELLTAREAREIDGWSRGPRIPADVDLADLVALHARRDPSRIAVEAFDGTLTYAELDAEVSRLAASLDVVPVGVCLGNSKHLPVVMLAIWRAGATYVPLDPALPAARIEYLLRDAGVRLLITDAAGRERFGHCGTRILLAGEDAGRAAGEAPPSPHPEDVAYVIYTSGSTGQPKGVMVPYRGLRALIAALLHTLDLDGDDRVLKFATQSFDAAVFEMTAALSAGATLCLEPQDELLPRPELIGLLRRRRITMLTITPSSLGVLPFESLPALRTLFVAGEACPADLVARWAPGRRMINGYGPTETSVWATYADVDVEGGKPAIGKPVANARVRVVDARGRLVPVGVPGELSIAGPSVALGYLARPDATAVAFVPDPNAPESRMYRTGDLVRWRPDGNLDFLGRADTQIKLRGVRIEPSEIEAVIASFAGVAAAVVVPQGDVLVAYVVPLADVTIDGATLRRALQDRLPRFLVPSRVMVLDALPRTSSGKLDRNALPTPAAETPAVVPEPMSGIEERIARIWSDVLSTPVTPADDFFDLGGHSLLVTRVLSRVREDLGLDVPVRRMFEAPTLGAFCEGLELPETAPPSRIPPSPLRREQQKSTEVW